ncbi:MAG: FAD-dependent oxidoreductase [Bacteriovoracaceae bacterium]|nr:FAD-dependent oxidoreductase [Bacteriovoracaceae bacterium]
MARDQGLNKLQNIVKAELKLSRRQLLMNAFKLAAVATISPTKLWSQGSAFNKRITILGGGVAGLTSAYYLQQQGYIVDLYEASTRLGGRIYTRENFLGNQFCELGAELIDTNHSSMIALASELGCEIEYFPVNHKEEQLLFYDKQGLPHTEAEVIAAFKPIAPMVAGDIAECSDETKRLKWDKISLAEYFAQKKLKDAAPEWLLSLLTLAYEAEYGQSAELQTSLNFLDLFKADLVTNKTFPLFGLSDEASRIKGGNSQLIYKLIEKTKNKVNYHLEHTLVGVSEKTNSIQLQFANGKTVTAENVICSIPFSVLREVDGIKKSRSITPDMKTAIERMTYGQNSKLMLGFESAWWKKAAKDKPVSNGSIYVAQGNLNLWDTTRLQAGSTAIMTQFFVDKTPRRVEDLVKDVTHFTDRYANKIIKHTYMPWSKSPFVKGSYACPSVGHYEHIYSNFEEAKSDHKWIFIGEHTKYETLGFMEAAVSSAQQFKANAPSKAPASI